MDILQKRKVLRDGGEEMGSKTNEDVLCTCINSPLVM